MSRFKNDKGLTLIELLITISVLAVVSAIALPVINNVVTSSNSNALTQTIKDAEDFIAKYSKSGVVVYDGLRTLSGYVDADGDNVIDASEKIDALTLNEKYSMSATGSSSVGGQYSNGGVTAVSVTTAGSGSTSGTTSGTPVSQTTANVAYDWDINQWELVITDLNTVQSGDTVVVVANTVNAGIDVNISGTYTVSSVTTKNEIVGYDQATATYIYGDRVHIKLGSTFQDAFQGAAGFWASSWYAGVQISVTR